MNLAVIIIVNLCLLHLPIATMGRELICRCPPEATTIMVDRNNLRYCVKTINRQLIQRWPCNYKSIGSFFKRYLKLL